MSQTPAVEHPCPDNPLALNLCENDYSRSIRKLCEKAHMSEMADGFIHAGLSVDEVRETLFNALCARRKRQTYNPY